LCCFDEVNEDWGRSERKDGSYYLLDAVRFNAFCFLGLLTVKRRVKPAPWKYHFGTKFLLVLKEIRFLRLIDLAGLARFLFVLTVLGFLRALFSTPRVFLDEHERKEGKKMKGKKKRKSNCRFFRDNKLIKGEYIDFGFFENFPQVAS